MTACSEYYERTSSYNDIYVFHSPSLQRIVTSLHTISYRLQLALLTSFHLLIWAPSLIFTARVTIPSSPMTLSLLLNRCSQPMKCHIAQGSDIPAKNSLTVQHMGHTRISRSTRIYIRALITCVQVQNGERSRNTHHNVCYTN